MAASLVSPGRLLIRQLISIVIAAAITVLLWIVVLRAFNVNDVVGQRPWDVWAHLVTDDKAAANRAEIFTPLRLTLRDAGVGYVVGLLASVVLGAALAMSDTAEKTLMPGIMLVRSIPLLVLTPLVTLVFGVNLWAVVTITTLLVFFPATVNVIDGLRSVSPQLVDLVRVYDGNSWAVLRKVSVISAVPSLFASARVTVPLAMTGALTGEWLATGEGLGGAVSRASASFGYGMMWAAAVVITAVTMLAYLVVSVVEIFVVHRIGVVGRE